MQAALQTSRHRVPVVKRRQIRLWQLPLLLNTQHWIEPRCPSHSDERSTSFNERFQPILFRLRQLHRPRNQDDAVLRQILRQNRPIQCIERHACVSQNLMNVMTRPTPLTITQRLTISIQNNRYRIQYALPFPFPCSLLNIPGISH
mgnify:CR=1 FL=1